MEDSNTTIGIKTSNFMKHMKSYYIYFICFIISILARMSQPTIYAKPKELTLEQKKKLLERKKKQLKKKRSLSRGETKGVRNIKKWTPNYKPYDMEFIPGGRVFLGAREEDFRNIPYNTQLIVTVSSFYMDKTPVTNVKYKQYIDDMVTKLTLEEEIKKQDQEANNPSEDEEENEEDQEMTETSEEENEAAAINTVEKKEEVIEETSEEVKALLEKISPDTTVWLNDIVHTVNDKSESYFTHPAFDEYPVVGVTWQQAKDFCKWRTDYLNEYRKAKNQEIVPSFRLPTRAEWMRAASGDEYLIVYPWGTPFITDYNGEPYANCKWSEDGGEASCAPCYVRDSKYKPNKYGIYHLSGNVNEWCEDSFDPIAHAVINIENPCYVNKETNQKIIVGGSYNDPKDFLKIDTIMHMDGNKTSPTIGFRCVMPYLNK